MKLLDSIPEHQKQEGSSEDSSDSDTDRSEDKTLSDTSVLFHECQRLLTDIEETEQELETMELQARTRGILSQITDLIYFMQEQLNKAFMSPWMKAQARHRELRQCPALYKAWREATGRECTGTL